MNKVLLIIPAYNEEANIQMVVEELRDHYPELDYVVVNDGSSDRTAQICRERGFNLLDLPVNLGLAGCFQAGMKYAYYKGYPYAIQFDGDGQHRPEFIASMAEKMEETPDATLYNSAVAIGPDGVIGAYQKMHPFETESIWCVKGEKPFMFHGVRSQWASASIHISSLNSRDTTADRAADFT